MKNSGPDPLFTSGSAHVAQFRCYESYPYFNTVKLEQSGALINSFTASRESLKQNRCTDGSLKVSFPALGFKYTIIFISYHNQSFVRSNLSPNYSQTWITLPLVYHSCCFSLFSILDFQEESTDCPLVHSHGQ